MRELVGEPYWPLGTTATYKAINRGQIPTVTLAGTTYVVMPALMEMMSTGQAPTTAAA